MRKQNPRQTAVRTKIWLKCFRIAIAIRDGDCEGGTDPHPQDLGITKALAVGASVFMFLGS